jgi:murein DD-endopeptidase MepM/ murein hydrolase activator NlpD
MVRPVDAQWPVSQNFGDGATQGVAPNSDPNSGTGYLVYLYGNYQPYGHAGQDIAVPIGTPVYAISDGTVLWADWGMNLPGDETDAGYRERWYLYKGFPGIVSVIQHPWGLGVYAHLSSNDAAPAGTQVQEGEVIGLSGNTGGVAPHLHVGAIVDLNYSTGNGLIYGCTNPEPFYGGTIQTASSGETPIPTEEDMAVTDDDLRKIYQAVWFGTPGADLIQDRRPGQPPAWPETHLGSMLDRLQEQVLKPALASLPAPDVAAQIDAAGTAKEVLAELVKILEAKQA